MAVYLQTRKNQTGKNQFSPGMTIAPDVLDMLPPTPYEQARTLVADGDILLCSAHDPMSRLIRWATKSPWSHIAMAFHIRDIGRVIVLECVARLGVRAVPLSDFVSRTSSGVHPYPGRILVARHAGMAAREGGAHLRQMSEYAFDRLGTPYSNLETAKIALRVAAGRLNLRMPGRLSPDDEFVCSEYVARCYAHIGLPVPWDGLGFVAPADFANDPALSAVAQVATR
jgi:hypothetical protein